MVSTAIAVELVMSTFARQGVTTAAAVYAIPTAATRYLVVASVALGFVGTSTPRKGIVSAAADQNIFAVLARQAVSPRARPDCVMPPATDGDVRITPTDKPIRPSAPFEPVLAAPT